MVVVATLIQGGTYFYKNIRDNITTSEFIENDLFGFYYCIIYIPSNKTNYHVISRIDGLYFSEKIM